MTQAKPTLCFLTGTLNALAGAERMTATIANALAEQGYTVTILSLWDPASCFALHPTIRHEALFTERPSFKRAYMATVAGIRRHLKAHRIDVLVQVDTMLSLFALPAALGLGVRHIAWEHCHFDEDLGRRARRWARRLAARYCTNVVVLTERDRKRWLEALRPRSSIVCIPNPLPFALPAQPAPRTSKTVLAVGRLVHTKGFDVLLNAWALVTQRMPDWKLMIVGEGEERQALETLRDQLGLRANVALPGAFSDITKAYEQASIFCLSSRYEGFGLVLIEAMAFGLPIVSTTCETGPRELLEDKRDAIMVDVDDHLALANALFDLISNHAEADKLARGAGEKAKLFSMERIAREWNALLR
ncbi:GalNAc-alpha-(1-_4)-GalNAc-alpha-(1-_3)-diNAcBac-PP-undecaprenol alpha-1,4-N-acetyl-D-galactosaminyltransferase [Ralstonia mannitolilytica]|uniref:glycosyltransferase family 4 protein n=1 Tax=Ralstonia mannitolilytica TaxID=105219 RepID=UPI0028F57318|nr:glycosyltransferase family 4 protein [Ralstonia mannitolilytica]CAJ0681120.1 GalNAc-alpha-(1->4)-GalNAc-alpha-(1->3)-diNAcBac-PP-undecaprenol alpha-1,4-N-acetyl-D-galactosaminyltransferase [Ralstonia mannitolilytica]CAJ0872306.1 GalNAc-alpha-(1->4)-GalNAc-alpha-(1->3)-diNAcBac-PP-undecaprenol alpha-1,4-N-acetyl-D-galactosaminyltransferase [Ralstonia mannitolilytica]